MSISFEDQAGWMLDSRHFPTPHRAARGWPEEFERLETRVRKQTGSQNLDGFRERDVDAASPLSQYIAGSSEYG